MGINNRTVIYNHVYTYTYVVYPTDVIGIYDSYKEFERFGTLTMLVGDATLHPMIVLLYIFIIVN